MNWSRPTTEEHELVLDFIRRIRRGDIIWSVVFFVLAAGAVCLGVWMLTDGTLLGITPVILGLFFGLVGLGLAISDRDRLKKITNKDYWVSRCRVVSREAQAAMRHTNRYVSVLCPNGNTSRYKVAGHVYRRAGVEGAKALLVDYTDEHKGHRQIGIDCVV